MCNRRHSTASPRRAVGNIKLVLRTWDNPALLANSCAAVTSVDAQHPLFDIQTLEQGVADLVAQRGSLCS